MTNAQLNTAILKVLKAWKKYECEDEYKAVKKAGYDIRKQGDHFEVYASKELGCRSIYLTYRDRYGANHDWTRQYTLYVSGGARKISDITKVDFVAILNTKPNREWYAARSIDYNRNCPAETKARKAKWRLDCLRHDAMISHNNALRAQRDIEELQSRVAHLTADYGRYLANEQKFLCELEKYRKELGLA